MQLDTFFVYLILACQWDNNGLCLCQRYIHESVDTFTTLCDFPLIHAVVLLNTVINERADSRGDGQC